MGLRCPAPSTEEEDGHRTDISVFPLAFPLLAGPGALTSIVLLMARAPSPLEAAGVILALIIVMAVKLGLLLAASQGLLLLRIPGTNGVGPVLGIIPPAPAAPYALE